MADAVDSANDQMQVQLQNVLDSRREAMNQQGLRYRYCVDCAVEIPSKRLEARPYAMRCIECQSDHEATAQQYR